MGKLIAILLIIASATVVTVAATITVAGVTNSRAQQTTSFSKGVRVVQATNSVVIEEAATFLDEVMNYIKSVAFITLLSAGIIGLIVWYGKAWITFQFEKRKVKWIASRQAKLLKKQTK